MLMLRMREYVTRSKALNVTIGNGSSTASVKATVSSNLHLRLEQRLHLQQKALGKSRIHI